MKELESSDLDERSSDDQALIRRICIIHAIMVVVVGYALVKGVPHFEKIFKDFDAELPYLTQMMINVSNFFMRGWFVVVPAWVGLIGACVMLVRTKCSSEARLLSNILLLLYGIFFLVFVVAMCLPLVALVQKLS